MGKRTNPGAIIPIVLIFLILFSNSYEYDPTPWIATLVIFVFLDLARGKVKGWDKSILVIAWANLGTFLDDSSVMKGSNQHPPQLPQSSFPGADGGNSMRNYRCPMGHTMTSITIPPSCPFCGKPMIPN